MSDNDDKKNSPDYSTPESWGQKYPDEHDFFKIKKQEFSGLLPRHSVQMTLSLPYFDWCKFEASQVYQDLTDYLWEAEKQSNLRRKIETEGESEHAV